MVSISITALHDPVSIVHVPVSGATMYSSKLFWTLDRARDDSSEFFNYTSNRIEIALFASVDLVEDEWGSLLDTDPSVRINGPWRVFEISSGDDDEGANDSPHLRHVSAPLAAAGVSILYQSSYFTDFLMVKSEDFERASRIFKTRGWHVDPLTPPVRRRSVHLARGDVDLYRPILSPVAPPPPPVAEITVLSSPLACVGISRDTEDRNGERVKKFLVWPERAIAALERERGEADNYVNGGGSPTLMMRRRSSSERRSRSPSARPFISYTRTEDGASVLTEVRVLRAMFNSPEQKGDILSAGELERASESEWTGEDDDDDDEDDNDDDSDDDSASDPASNEPTSPSPQTSPRHAHSLPGTPRDFYGSATFSSIPLHWTGSSSGTGSAATTPTSTSCSYRHSHSFGLGVGMTPIYPTHSRTQSDSEQSARVLDGLPRLRRASEGAAQRLELFDEPRDLREPIESPTPPTMRCLQLDLRGIGGSDDTHLDKSGLVTRFSSVLYKGGVRMLYSSTTHTANLLVQGTDVYKAEELLRVGEDE